MKAALLICLAGCVVTPAAVSPPPAPPLVGVEVEQDEEPEVRTPKPEREAATPRPDTKPACREPLEAEFAALKVRLEEARARTEEWAKTHCEPAINRQVTWSKRNVRQESGGTSMWVCDKGVPVQVVESTEERSLRRDMLYVRSKILKC